MPLVTEKGPEPHLLSARQDTVNHSFKWSLTLYIAGPKHPKSKAAYANLKRICEEHIPGPYDLTVVDVTQEPRKAMEDQIIAIPTLVRNSPLPVRRIIGDLYDTNKVLVSLDLASIASYSAR